MRVPILNDAALRGRLLPLTLVLLCTARATASLKRRRRGLKPACLRRCCGSTAARCGGWSSGRNKNVFAYKGIPYAAPPVGELRWKPPQAVKPWGGVRDCFEFGAACPQNVPILLRAIQAMSLGAPVSEDCLFINVWTPASRDGDKLPVLYWIHGGGFVMGAASQPIYDGAELARLGCVVVSVNYRLGAFGFLAHPSLSAESPDHISGNYGLLDQIEGLRWVHRNIAAFGGDPDRVTIFGESAGGISVLCLMVALQARGLFHAAIAQSATALDLMPLRSEKQQGGETAEGAGQRLMTACGLGQSPDAGQMRQIDYRQVVKSTPVELSAALRLKPLSLVVGPCVDGNVIPDAPPSVFRAGHEHRVPLMIGCTHDEMSLFLLAAQMPADEAAYRKLLKDDFGDSADALFGAYPAHGTTIRPAIVQLTTDLAFTRDARFIARAHAAAGNKSFRYLFSRGTGWGFLRALGAHHGADVAYVFQRPLGDNETDRRISRAMGQYWVHFAAAADPNAVGLANWPAYRPDEEAMVEFGQDVSVVRGYRNEPLDLLEKVLRPAADKADDR